MTNPRQKRMELRRQEIIAALREVANRLGPNISIAGFYRETGITDRKVYQLFDNWSDLRIQAGLPAEVNRSRTRYSREELLQQLHDLAAEIGDDISSTEFSSRTGISACP